MCGTLSKALGGFGGIIPGPQAFIAEVKAKSRWFNGASAPAAPVAGATAAALSIVTADPAVRARLGANVARLRAGLRGLGLSIPDLPTPIICTRIGDGPNMARIQKALMDRGIAIAHTRNYAGVGPDGALRIAVFSTHTDAMIDRLIAEMGAVI
jgi:7-keto-8-aminopelargonate synthetase-like enzyme